MNENEFGKVEMSLNQYNALVHTNETYKRKNEDLNYMLNRKQDLVNCLLKEYVRYAGSTYRIDKDNIEKAYDLQSFNCILPLERVIRLINFGATEYEIQCAIKEVAMEEVDKETDNG